MCALKVTAELRELISSVEAPPLTFSRRIWACLRDSLCTPDNLQVAYLLSYLGIQLIARNEPHEAEILHRRALCIGSTRLGSNHPQLSSSLDWLGLALFVQGNYTEALLTCFATRALIRRTMERRHPSLCICLMNMAMVYDAMGWSLCAWQMREEASRILLEGMGGA